MEAPPPSPCPDADGWQQKPTRTKKKKERPVEDPAPPPLPPKPRVDVRVYADEIGGKWHARVMTTDQTLEIACSFFNEMPSVIRDHLKSAREGCNFDVQAVIVDGKAHGKAYEYLLKEVKWKLRDK